MRTLILCSTTDGHTWAICQFIQKQLEQRDHDVLLVHIEDSKKEFVSETDSIILGASIRYGKHQKLVYDFIKEHQEVLEEKPSSFFSVNLVARKEEKRTQETNPYVKKFLKQIKWRPRLVGVFAGKLNYPIYGFFDRIMIQFIMYMTKGPTDPATVREFTNWEEVEKYIENFLSLTCDS